MEKSRSTHHVDCCADEDAVVKGPEECDKEANKARNQIDPFKIVLSRQTRQHKFLLLFSEIGYSFFLLTFTVPYWICFFLSYFYCPKLDG